MATSDNDASNTLNLSPNEKTAFSFLFQQADSDNLGVVTGERAVGFFERTKVNPTVLGEIWQIADTENRGLLTKPGFCMVLRLIGHYQAGREPSAELAFKQAPIPTFEGLSIPGAPGVVGGGVPPGGLPQNQASTGPPANALQPPNTAQGGIAVPRLDPQKVAQYRGLFQHSGAQNGLLNGASAKSIFEKADLSVDVLGKIWMLSDRQERGALDEVEFIVAMHLLTSFKMGAMKALPNTLPQGLYNAAAYRAPPGPPPSRQGTGQAQIPRQFTGGSVGAPPRTQSPLASRPPGYGTPPPQSAQVTGQGQHWLITAQEKGNYDRFFSGIDTAGRGIITGEQAVRFFSDSGISEDTLASIWDLADINSEGQLNRDEFAVAMYLIKQQRAPNAPPLPAFLPQQLIPPSMRRQGVQQQTQQTTAPAFDNANNTSNLPKSAADDLFGLDEPSPPQPQQQPAALQTQGTGASAARDSFNSSVPGSPSSPQRFQPQPQQSGAGSMFKPFQPTSAFGASLQSQHTGGSATSSQGQPRGIQPQQTGFSQPQQQQAPQQQQYRPPQSSTMDDLLGDDESHAQESSKMTSDTTELANMSSQLGNLRTQMGETQSKKQASQAELTATQNQKRDLELRLQHFRSQYETEVRSVKELEQQLATSRESTKKLSQDLAMLEGTYQDLQTQHQNVTQALQADQAENNNVKQRTGQLNAEISRLKPEIEKLKLDARQQKGMVSINKKQLTTNESERDRLQGEKADLEREAAEREEAARNAPAPEPEPVRSQVASPTASTMSSTNPFFRKASAEQSAPAERSMSPGSAMASAPTPSAFDQLFGPAFAHAAPQVNSRSGTPPATSFVGRNIAPAAAGAAVGAMGGAALASGAGGMTDSVSSDDRPTPSATPPLSDRGLKDSPQGPSDVPPPPPESRQFMPSHLPVGGLNERPKAESEASSTRVLPPASRAGGIETPKEPAEPQPTNTEGSGGYDPPEPTPAVEQEMPGGFGQELGHIRGTESVPGAFPDEPAQTTTKEISGPSSGVASPAPQAPKAHDDFDSAFAGFGDNDEAKEGQHDDPFAPSGSTQQPSSQARGFDDDAFAPSSSSHQQPAQQSSGFGSAFPSVQQHEATDESSDDDEGPEPIRGYNNSFDGPSAARTSVAVADHPTQHLSDEQQLASSIPIPAVASGTDLAAARPGMKSIESTASDLPNITSQQSPPTYQESDNKAHGGNGERTGSNQFPPEFNNLLPSREDPTSPPLPTSSPPQSSDSDRPFQTPGANGQTLFPPNAQTPASIAGTANTDSMFFDASSRPMSSVTDVGAGGPSTLQHQQQQHTQPAAQKNAFDDFDDFNDLSEAKEADKGSDFDFGFGDHSRENSDFNAAFDSPAASMTNTMRSEQTPTPSVTQRAQPESNGFSDFTPNASTNSGPFGRASGNSSLQQTPQNAQHDWDAIFSGLDNSASNNIDTNFGASNDPWATGTTNAAAAAETPKAASPEPARTAKPSETQYAPPPGPPPSKAKDGAPLGRALTPGTEHDDPILKRLTGMGYPRNDALNALEMFDYDINKAVDHLTSS